MQMVLQFIHPSMVFAFLMAVLIPLTSVLLVIHSCPRSFSAGFFFFSHPIFVHLIVPD